MALNLVGVTGGSGSGKSTLARALSEAIGMEKCAILSQDHYYRDQSARFKEDGGEVNFDHPDALDFELLRKHLESLKAGNRIQVPIYEFATHKRLEQCEIMECKPVVIVDGTLLLSQEPLRPFFKISIFLEVSEELRYQRRLQRDVRERGRTPEGVNKQFMNQVKPMHDRFVEPSKIFADLVFDEKMSIPHMVKKIMAQLFPN